MFAEITFSLDCTQKKILNHTLLCSYAYRSCHGKFLHDEREIFYTMTCMKYSATTKTGMSYLISIIDYYYKFLFTNYYIDLSKDADPLMMNEKTKGSRLLLNKI